MVKLDGRELEYVPRRLRTQELCLAAVKSRQAALDHIPHKIALLGILPYTQRERS
jgi:hypothetical protein